MCEVDTKEIVVQEQQPPKTLSLGVAGATNTGSHAWKADFDPTGTNKIVVTATTNDGPVTWTVAPSTARVAANGTTATIALNEADNVLPEGTLLTVKATTANVATTPVESFLIRPNIDKLEVVKDHYAFDSGPGGWYALNLSGMAGVDAASLTAQLKATTTPDTPAAYSHLNWQAVNSADSDAPVALIAVREPGASVDNPAKRAFALNANATVKTTVWLKSDANSASGKTASVDVRAPATTAVLAPGFEIQLFTFDFGGAGRFPVMKEAKAQEKKTFKPTYYYDEPALPQGYAAGTGLKLEGVEIWLRKAPTDDSNAYLRASVYFCKQNGSLAVTTRNGTVAIPKNKKFLDSFSIGDLDFGNVPGEVMYNNPLLIFWEASPDNSNWQPLVVTPAPVYVTAAKPVYATKLKKESSTASAQLNDSTLGSVCTYDSLLAISCQAVIDFNKAGTIQDDVRKAIAKAFSDQVDPNPRMKRLNRETSGSAKTLTYWLDHANSSAIPPAQSVNGTKDPALGGNIFNNDAGNVACGAWADMLICMWALHGIGDGHKVSVVRNKALNTKAADFLVKNWVYSNSVAMSNTAFTHNYGSQSDATVQLPAQNNGASPDSFTNHFIVLDSTNNSYYDPSYGATAAQPGDWVKAASDGLIGKVSSVWKTGYATRGGGNTIVPNPKVVTFTDMTDDSDLWS